MQSEIDGKIQILWESVLKSCNKVLHQANSYGFELMTLPDPNIHQIADALDVIIIPMLDKLVKIGDFSPESGMKIANIKTYVLHLRAITIAINEENSIAFDKNVDLLMSESMLL